jgi:hypothetical protein
MPDRKIEQCRRRDELIYKLSVTAFFLVIVVAVMTMIMA